MSGSITIVDHDAELLRIERFQVRAHQARRILKAFLKADGPIDDQDAGDVYAALRGAVGRLLRSSAPREDLVGWYALLKGVQARLRPAALCDRIETLAELVYERAGMCDEARIDGAASMHGMDRLLDAVDAAGGPGEFVGVLARSIGIDDERMAVLDVAASDAGLVQVVVTARGRMLRAVPHSMRPDGELRPMRQPGR
jgi:hypothetical protein